MTTRPARRTRRHSGPPHTNFGDLITADHMVMGPQDAGRAGERTALVVKDAATGWIACYPLPDKSSEAATKALMELAGNSTVTLFYSDNAPELISAAPAMGWPHERATPGRPLTNGVADRAVRTVLDGTRSALLHAGFEERYWSLACQHWCFAHNVQYDKLGNTQRGCPDTKPSS